MARRPSRLTPKSCRPIAVGKAWNRGSSNQPAAKRLKFAEQPDRVEPDLGVVAVHLGGIVVRSQPNSTAASTTIATSAPRCAVVSGASRIGGVGARIAPAAMAVIPNTQRLCGALGCA